MFTEIFSFVINSVMSCFSLMDNFLLFDSFSLLDFFVSIIIFKIILHIISFLKHDIQVEKDESIGGVKK